MADSIGRIAEPRRGRPDGLHPRSGASGGGAGDHRAAIDRGKRFGVTHHAEPARGAGVVITRAHVCTIVVKWAADLFGRSLAERAHALIAIAHPDFRDELRLTARRPHLEQ